MQTVKMLTELHGEDVPIHEKYFVELYETQKVEYRWYKLTQSEYLKFLENHSGIYAPFDSDSYFKRRKEADMIDELPFCYLYFFDSSSEKVIQYALVDTIVFIMNSAGQTIDKIYS